MQGAASTGAESASRSSVALSMTRSARLAKQRTECVREHRKALRAASRRCQCAYTSRLAKHAHNAADGRCFATCNVPSGRFTFAPLARSGSWTGS